MTIRLNLNLDASNTQLTLTPAIQATPATHSMHQLDVTTPAPVTQEMVIEIQWLLANFTEFDGFHNDVARVATAWYAGKRYALFEMRGFAGLLTRILNGSLAVVRIACAPGEVVYGDTTEQHMLIGQRRWSVTATIGSNLLQIVTAAQERPKGYLNKLGMLGIGRDKQRQLWLAYLQNLGDTLLRDYKGQGKINISLPTPIAVNSWSPVNPYPNRSGC